VRERTTMDSKIQPVDKRERLLEIARQDIQIHYTNCSPETFLTGLRALGEAVNAMWEIMADEQKES
jgi:hypothetical protein